MVTISTDLTRFSSAGYGRVRIPPELHLSLGETVGVTDDGADTMTAEVFGIYGDRAEVRLDWDHVIAYAD